MAKTAVAPDIHEPLDVHGSFGAQRALDLVIALDLTPETIHIVVVEILSASIRIHTTRGDNFFRARRADAEDVRQCDLDALTTREIDASDTCHDLRYP